MELLRELLSRATADGSRTNALNHLHWMLVAFAVLTASSAYAKLPEWIIVMFAAVTGVFLVCYLVTHFYFMFKNPDALRSEKFSIEKMAIERGMYGDSVAGMKELSRSKTKQIVDGQEREV